jgi:hypothetical protein
MKSMRTDIHLLNGTGRTPSMSSVDGSRVASDKLTQWHWSRAMQVATMGFISLCSLEIEELRFSIKAQSVRTVTKEGGRAIQIIPLAMAHVKTPHGAYYFPITLPQRLSRNHMCNVEAYI